MADAPMTQMQAQQMIELLKQIAESVKTIEDWVGYQAISPKHQGRPSVPKKQKRIRISTGHA
jgi:hypothetical protein